MRDHLSLDAFQECAVWAFADDEEHYRRLEVTGHLPNDVSPLFVRCEVTTAAGRSLPGYAVVSAGVYAVAVLTADSEYVFNVSLPELVPAAEAGVRAAYELPNGEVVVPLRYACLYGFRNQPNIAGCLNPIE